ncbi:hypothetical protein CC117_20265 [Parafrankia colletiae]|uniref:Glycoside hydrolase family 5 C-terminal domain-containing protein n=1 Tax=Parafrankia colletiae TaxID=573497 RepID=A0A1S1QME8_9ACTN|nr:hypothetical protein CC117_20265 [Parafrankia colletiae]
MLAGLLVASGEGVGLAGRVGAASTTAAEVPPGTVSRTANFLTDAAGRVVLPRGVTVPAGAVPTAEELRRWLDYGFTAARLELPMTVGGGFPPTGAQPPAGDREQGGLEQAGALVADLTDHGLTVVLSIVPGARGYQPSTSDLTAGLRRLAERFRTTGGLIGFEVPPTPAAGDLATALRAADPHRTLWVGQQAPFDPAAQVAANGGAGYITAWAEGTPARAAQLAAAGDAFSLGWFYDAPDADGRPATGIGPGEVRDAATPPAEIVRPYPAAVAGVPTSYGSDGAGVFRLVYRPVRAGGGALPAGTPTAVIVPGWNYSAGYQARVTGGQVTSAPGAGVLCVVTAAGATEVRVEIVPAEGTAPVAPPRAGAVNCPTGPTGGAAAADAAGGTGAPGSPGAGTPAAAPAAGAGAGADADPSLLLLVLPLLGAALTAAVLGPVFVRLRRR